MVGMCVWGGCGGVWVCGCVSFGHGTKGMCYIIRYYTWDCFCIILDLALSNCFSKKNKTKKKKPLYVKINNIVLM